MNINQFTMLTTASLALALTASHELTAAKPFTTMQEKIKKQAPWKLLASGKAFDTKKNDT